MYLSMVYLVITNTRGNNVGEDHQETIVDFDDLYYADFIRCLYIRIAYKYFTDTKHCLVYCMVY